MLYPVKDWIKFLFWANEIRGTDTLIRMWPSLVHQYAAGWNTIIWLSHHTDAIVHLVAKG